MGSFTAFLSSWHIFLQKTPFLPPFVLLSLFMSRVSPCCERFYHGNAKKLLYSFISVFTFLFLLKMMAVKVLELNISSKSPIGIVFQKITLSCLTRSPENFWRCDFPSTSSHRTKSQISSPTCNSTPCSVPCTDAWLFPTAVFNAASQLEIPPWPSVRRAQICSLPFPSCLSHGIWPREDSGCPGTNESPLYFFFQPYVS